MNQKQYAERYMNSQWKSFTVRESPTCIITSMVDLLTSVYFLLLYNSVRETLWGFIEHSVLLGESFHRTELISV